MRAPRIAGGTRQHGQFFDNDLRPSTLLVKNVMTNNETGIFLNYAIIGIQGSTTQALDNEWIGTYTLPTPHNPHTETYGLAADGTLSKFFVQSTTTTNPTANANTNGSLFAIDVEIENTAWPSGCPFTAPSYKQEEEQTPDLSDALNIVNPTTEPQTLRGNSMQWAGQYGLYKQLLADENLRVADESLNDFFIVRDGGNMGRLHRAMSDFNQLRNADGSGLQSASAEDQLGAVQGLVSDSRVEQRLAEVLTILYSNIADLKTFEGGQEARLREIAQLCPLDEGFAVFIARSALLKLDTLPRHYTSECERMPDPQAVDSWKNTQTDTTQKEFSVYPNPSNGSFAVNYRLNDRENGTAYLFNTLGEVVYQTRLDASTTVMNVEINGLSSGIYVLRVDVDGSHRLVERITVLLSEE
ncbi:MAG: T9SS type A sorting domain-containing protein [Flavobacteriales bacterium]|nr:T9SS type A sorting domain-containing protein [Flavobacteriales bacterium]